MVQDDRERVGAALGSHAQIGLLWIDRLPDPSSTYRLLIGNEEALHRVTTILESAPAVIEDLASNAELSHCAIADEVLTKGFADLALQTPPPEVARRFREALIAAEVRWVLDPSFDLGQALTSAHDALLRHICGRLCVDADLVALGSYGAQDMTVGSDLDLLVLVQSDKRTAIAHCVSLLEFVASLNRVGAGVNLDFGLESAQATLRNGLPSAWTHEEFGQYDLEGMDLVERFNLGNARLVWGAEAAGRLATKTATGLPLTPERLKELVTHKRRVETELVFPQYRRRDVKRGWGGLSDIEWFVHLNEMRFPTATGAGTVLDMDARIHALATARLINSIERDELVEARRHLRELRIRLPLLGFARDVIPENPDKLGRLAHAVGYADGNDFLAYHERVIDTVRAIYVEGLERLKA